MSRLGESFDMRARFLVCCSAAVVAATLLAGQASAEGLGDLNTVAREIYAKGRTALLAAADPVIVVADELVLHHAGQRVSVPFTPPLYHQLKNVAHLPLGIFGALVAVATGTARDDGSWREDLARLEQKAVAANDEFAALAVAKPVKYRARKVFEESLAFMRTRREANAPPDWDMLVAYSRSMAPLVLALTTEAANVQIDGLHIAVQRWKAELGPEAWSRLYVLVLGPKTPRVDYLAYQYFATELGPG
ncbi:MAG: hypothetical protein JSS20_15775, partial [Proteobacteria bacterium]|nr:hypothetical protein [Pseudomonadota bacterium]